MVLFKFTTTLDSFASEVLKGYAPLAKILYSCDPAYKIYLVRLGHFKLNIKFSILKLWIQFYALDSTDPRDRIFALLGIAKTHPLKLGADYTKQASDVFIHFGHSVSYSSNSQARCPMHWSHQHEFESTRSGNDYIAYMGSRLQLIKFSF
jgi:hypothetical protein